MPRSTRARKQFYQNEGERVRARARITRFGGRAGKGFARLRGYFVVMSYKVGIAFWSDSEPGHYLFRNSLKTLHHSVSHRPVALVPLDSITDRKSPSTNLESIQIPFPNPPQPPPPICLLNLYSSEPLKRSVQSSLIRHIRRKHGDTDLFILIWSSNFSELLCLSELSLKCESLIP